jgi:glycosyltransferase involved in cell wall biosynthesis
MDKPLVSVIIPAYNAEAWIVETVSSALAQTYTPVEIIVVDDTSKDGTLRALESFKRRIRVLQNTTNLGVSGSRNRGIATAAGHYIALLDHDDLWHPEKISRQMDLFQKIPNLGLVYSDANIETQEGNQWRYSQASMPYRGLVFKQLIKENFIACATSVIPQSVLAEVGLFNEKLKILEDHDLFLRIARRFPIDYIDATLATYRIHDRNFTRHRDIYHAERIWVQSLYADEVSLEGEMALHHLGLGAALIRGRHLLSGTQALSRGLWGAFSHSVKFAQAAIRTWHRKKRVSP